MRTEIRSFPVGIAGALDATSLASGAFVVADLNIASAAERASVGRLILLILPDTVSGTKLLRPHP